MHLPKCVLWSFVLAGLPLSLSGCGETPTAAAPAPAKVTVQTPEVRELTDFAEYNGWIAANATVAVRARVRGHIQQVHFTDGQIVAAGDLLFELDPRPFQSDIDRAKEQLKIFQAQHVAAVKDETRLRELLDKGGASLAQVEKAEADAAALAAQIGGSEEEIRRRELELSYSRITAEIGGRVGQAMLQAGNLVNAGGTDPILTTIVAVDPVRVNFAIDERILLRYTERMGVEGKNATEMLAKLSEAGAEAPLHFALDGTTDFSHQGKLKFANNEVDPATGTLQIYGIVDNKEGKLVPGSRVRVRVTVGKPYRALLVPETAILSDQDKRYVLIADNENVVRRRDVTPGKLTDDGLRAIAPKAAGEGSSPETWSVLVDNLQRARINYPIDPQQPASPAPSPPRTPPAAPIETPAT
jgi:RND family efflux transporter MFP subunit